MVIATHRCGHYGHAADDGHSQHCVCRQSESHDAHGDGRREIEPALYADTTPSDTYTRHINSQD